MARKKSVLGISSDEKPETKPEIVDNDLPFGEPVKSEPVPDEVLAAAPKSWFEPVKPETLANGADFHDFETEPKYTGIYERPLLREKAGKGPGEEIGSIMGFIHVDQNGTETVIGASKAVKDAIEKALGYLNGIKRPECRPVLSYEFLGKVPMSNGQSFRRFDIKLIGIV